MYILEINQKIEKMFFVFQISGFELGVAYSRNLGHYTSPVNVLTNNLEISQKIRGEIFQLNFPDNDGKT